MHTANVQSLVDASHSPEVRLPDAPPLTLTRNFGWIVGVCVASLVSLPLAIAWTAHLLLNGT